jgi:hypothetical protein
MRTLIAKNIPRYVDFVVTYFSGGADQKMMLLMSATFKTPT